MLLPLAGAVYYLYQVAEDQYATVFGFAVRSEETSQANSLLDGLTALGGGTSSSDTDILYEFIRSRAMVEAVEAELAVSEMFAKPDFDPVFAYGGQVEIEHLIDYWQRMVHVSYANGSGLIEVRVTAFTAEDSLAIAEAIERKATEMINNLSAVAREDSTRYAREDLEQGLQRLKVAREALTRFRSEARIVDPSADISGQIGLLNSLEAQQAEAIIELNLLLQNGRGDDPRVEQAQLRIDIIETLIEAERQKFGFGSGGGPETETGEGRNFSTLVGEFERLMVDLEYAQTSYLAAQTTLDGALARAQRQSRYLATYSDPSLAQAALYPKRSSLSALVGLVLLLSWLIGLLVYYSLRDRK
ncbi:sugar transporter [Jannaschia sp. M317]|uniref:sugar transporter n=1 Tax=Jannaschia sp. M317 TaxID=2867011 RepID=UPI0021A90023|nr:sugar transporter [Jannaschia sp. M317]